MLGVSDEYQYVRNLVILAGRFFDDYDTTGAQQGRRHHQATRDPALRFAKMRRSAKSIKLNGLPFTIIGTFRERVETFGQIGNLG